MHIKSVSKLSKCFLRHHISEVTEHVVAYIFTLLLLAYRILLTTVTD